MTLVLLPSFRRCFYDDDGVWRHPPGLGVLGMGDDPPELFPYPLPDQHKRARQVADGMCAGLVGEEEIDNLFDHDVAYDEKGRLDHCRLATFQAVYGNRKGKARTSARVSGEQGRLIA